MAAAVELPRSQPIGKQAAGQAHPMAGQGAESAFSQAQDPPEKDVVNSIRAGLAQARKDSADAVQGYRDVGEDLVAERNRRRRSQDWESWLKDNFNLSAQTARTYMRLHEKWDLACVGGPPASVRQAAARIRGKGADVDDTVDVVLKKGKDKKDKKDWKAKEVKSAIRALVKAAGLDITEMAAARLLAAAGVRPAQLVERAEKVKKGGGA